MKPASGRTHAYIATKLQNDATRLQVGTGLKRRQLLYLILAVVYAVVHRSNSITNSRSLYSKFRSLSHFPIYPFPVYTLNCSLAGLCDFVKYICRTNRSRRTVGVERANVCTHSLSIVNHDNFAKLPKS